MFCNGTALTAPSGDCWPRYYCQGRAEHPAPQDGVTGGNCTPGHYCPGKTPNPIPCLVSEVHKFYSFQDILSSTVEPHFLEFSYLLAMSNSNAFSLDLLFQLFINS